MAIGTEKANEEISDPDANNEGNLAKEIGDDANYQRQRHSGDDIFEEFAPNALSDAFLVVERVNFSLEQPAMHEHVNEILSK